jgi:hypothetical protein
LWLMYQLQNARFTTAPRMLDGDDEGWCGARHTQVCSRLPPLSSPLSPPLSPSLPYLSSSPPSASPAYVYPLFAVARSLLPSIRPAGVLSLCPINQSLSSSTPVPHLFPLQPMPPCPGVPPGVSQSLRYASMFEGSGELLSMGDSTMLFGTSLREGAFGALFPYSSTAHDAATKIQRIWREYTQRKIRAVRMLQVGDGGDGGMG